MVRRVSRRPLRVVIGFPHGRRIGGSERLLWSVLEHRELANLEPIVVTFEDGPFAADIAALGVPVAVIDPGRFRHPWRLGAAVRRAAGLLRSSRPDLCVSWLPRVQTVMAPAAAAARMRDRVVFFQHELGGHDRLSRPAVMLPCRWILANSGASLVSTQRFWPHRPGSVVWPGIEPPRQPRPEETARLRAELALPPERLTIAIVGRLVPVKGVDRMIESLALLRGHGIDATLLVVGGALPAVAPGHDEELRALAARLGLEERVVFCGHVTEPAAHIAMADVLVHASVGDGFGLVVLEAMALGVPAVVAEGSGVVEAVEDGVTGIVAPRGEPSALATAVAELLEDPARRRALASAAKQRFHDQFEADRMVERIGAELARVAAMRSR